MKIFGRYRDLVLYIALVFVISFVTVESYDYLGGPWEMPWSLLIGSVYMFFPLLTVVIVVGLISKENVFRYINLRFTFNRWFIVAWLLPVAASGLLLLVMILWPGIKYSADISAAIARFAKSLSPEQLEAMKQQSESFPFHPALISIIQALIAGPTINAFFSFGEEAGWRGLMHRQLKHLGFWKESIIVGIVWGFWHYPLIIRGHNYSEHPAIGVFMMVAFTILLSPIMLYILRKSGSVLTAAIFHGSLNAIAGIPLILTKGGNDLIAGITGITGFVSLAIIIIGLVIYDRYLAAEKIIFRNK